MKPILLLLPILLTGCTTLEPFGSAAVIGGTTYAASAVSKGNSLVTSLTPAITYGALEWHKSSRRKAEEATRKQAFEEGRAQANYQTYRWLVETQSNLNTR